MFKKREYFSVAGAQEELESGKEKGGPAPGPPFIPFKSLNFRSFRIYTAHMRLSQREV